VVEVTISLSSIYKYQPHINTKIIELKPIIQNNKQTEETDEFEQMDQSEAGPTIQEKHAAADRAIDEANEQAKRILDDAKSEVEQLRQELEEEKKQAFEEAQTSGYQAGYESGEQEGKQHYQEIIEQAQSVLVLAKKDYDATVQQSEQTISMLALEAASKILNKKLEDDPECFVDIVKGVMKEVREQKNITIYAHPNDYPLILSQKDELLSIFYTDAELSIFPDGDLTTGSCIVESTFGRIDASIESQLLELREKLYELSQEEKSEQ
jgi:flagellar assembly protein FliH